MVKGPRCTLMVIVIKENLLTDSQKVMASIVGLMEPYLKVTSNRAHEMVTDSGEV